MKKSIPHFGGPRIPGQGPKLLIGKPRVMEGTQTSLREGQKRLTVPMVPGARNIRTPADVVEGLPLDRDTARQFEEQLIDLARAPDIIAFRKVAISAIHEATAGDPALRGELAQRVFALYNATPKPDRRTLVQKSEPLVTDADLARLRPMLRMIPVAGPPQLVWLCEAAMDTLHERPGDPTPPGWPTDELEKGAGHKYLQRIPSGKQRPRYYYIYTRPQGRGLAAHTDLIQGSKFQIEHNGKQGHFEVLRPPDPETGAVTIRHDETGKTIHVRPQDLQRWITSQQARRTAIAQPKAPAPTPSSEDPSQAAAAPAEAKPAKAPKALGHVQLSDLGKGGYDSIEGFAKDVESLERQAEAAPDEREYAILPQVGGYALVSRSKAPKVVGESVGDQTKVFLRNANGTGIEEMQADYVVMEAADLVASHNALDFTKRGDYPEGVQERRYDQQASEQLKIERIANTLEPAIVANTNPDAVNGTPIVTESGVVLGGNGRTMGMQRAYGMYPEKAKALKDHLTKNAKAFGLSSAEVATMKQPILVRRIKAGDNKATLTKLGRRMNEALTQGLDPRSEEVAVSKFVTEDVVDSLVNHMDADQTLSEFLTASTSKKFVNDLERAGIIDQYDRGKFVNQSTGLLNEEGRQRVERVFAARLIPDADMLDAMPQSWRASIAQAVPSFLQAEANGWDMRPALLAAVKIDQDMQHKGYSRSAKDRERFANQGDMFERKEQTPLTSAMLAVLQDSGSKSRAFPKAMKQVAVEAARQKHDHGDIMSMFPAPKKTLETSLSEAFGLAKSDGEAPPAEALRWYLSQTITGELGLLLRAATKSGKVSASRILGRLKNFLLNQAKLDRNFAMALGAFPMTDSELTGLIRTYVAANAATLSKSFTKAHVDQAFDNAREALAKGNHNG